MSRAITARIRTRSAAVLVSMTSIAAIGAAQAQAPVPGEKWRMTTKMEVNGMAMPFPGRSMEMCVPVNRSAAALAAQPPDPKSDCKMINQKQTGNSFSADMVCSGRNAMTGRIESTQLSPTRSVSKMTMKSDEGTMVMTSESEKLGGSCDAAELERRMNRMMANAQAQQEKSLAQMCSDGVAGFKKEPGNVAGAANLFIGPNRSTPPQCTDAAQKKEFCGVVATRAGFRSLRRYDRQLERSEQDQARMGVNMPAASRSDPVMLRSFSSCGIAKNVAELEAHRKKLVDAAEKERDWGFFMAEAEPARIDVIGQAQCTGRAFTEAKNPAYKDFCMGWGARKAGRASDDMDDAGSAGSAMAGSGPGAAGAAGAQMPGQPGADPAAEEESQQPQNKAQRATDAVKRGLRGIFGGGGN